MCEMEKRTHILVYWVQLSKEGFCHLTCGRHREHVVWKNFIDFVWESVFALTLLTFLFCSIVDVVFCGHHCPIWILSLAPQSKCSFAVNRVLFQFSHCFIPAHFVRLPPRFTAGRVFDGWWDDFCQTQRFVSLLKFFFITLQYFVSRSQSSTCFCQYTITLSCDHFSTDTQSLCRTSRRMKYFSEPLKCFS